MRAVLIALLLTFATQAGAEKITKSIQSELNRLGCNVGKADGAIGPASKRALKQFSIANESFTYDVSVFSDPKFLKLLKDKRNGFCMRDWSQQIDGIYEGYLANKDQKYKVISTFKGKGGNKVQGKYVFYEDGGLVPGTFSKCKADKIRELFCKWRDKYGAGTLIMEFNADLTQFSGSWGVKKPNPNYYWNGKKQE